MGNEGVGEWGSGGVGEWGCGGVGEWGSGGVGNGGVGEWGSGGVILSFRFSKGIALTQLKMPLPPTPHSPLPYPPSSLNSVWVGDKEVPANLLVLVLVLSEI
ncbi:MAG: hypothetical protein DSM106950_30220 [Stigonema ocellatum SAG 48.90 = DSM 106950]|nr:hypothetical protein [Stigonema ocellatum SAG 48.90 = DSM 106950]